jgi:trehalose-phosphatase
MKDALAAKKEIRARMSKAARVALFLDFDGTLAPIVRDPAKAAISGDTRVLVEKLANRMHVYIVTGRSLKDIRVRAPLKEVEYAGNHGLEWTAKGKRHRGPVSQKAREDLRDALRGARAVGKMPGAFVENKTYSISFHYRNIAAAQVPEFIRQLKAVLWPIVARGRTEILEQKKVIEVRMRGADKGGFVRAALKNLPKGTLGIYIGDDTTDEDAFRALPEGVTVRVGDAGESAAAYRLSSQKDVDAFLSQLLA